MRILCDMSGLAQNRNDWDRPRIIAALARAGWSLRRLSVANGLRPGTLADALYRPWPRGEEIVAAAIGTTPGVIWPSRIAAREQRERAA